MPNTSDYFSNLTVQNSGAPSASNAATTQYANDLVNQAFTVITPTSLPSLNPLVPLTNYYVWRGTASSDITISEIAVPAVSSTFTIVNDSPNFASGVKIVETNAGPTSIIAGVSYAATSSSGTIILAKGDSISFKYDFSINRWVVVSKYGADRHYFSTGIPASFGQVVIPLSTRTTQAFTANTSYFYPLLVTENRTIRGLQSEVTTAVAGGNYRLAIFECNPSLAPVNLGALVLDSGNISTATVGTVFTTPTLPAILPRGIYWVQFAASASVGLRSGLPTSSPYTSAGAAYVTCSATAETFGTFTPNRTATFTASTVNAPLFLFR